jgi:mono/diheme cytochrome c family protein
MTRVISHALSLVVLVLSAGAAMAADAENGAQLAQRWCASCHIVAPNQQGPTSEAPPFARIANAPDFNAGKLALFLLDPHPKMPDMGLSRTAAQDLAAYIATLR